jgi:photosystem II stability/assembly factor-like uncharacterized protein
VLAVLAVALTSSLGTAAEATRTPAPGLDAVRFVDARHGWAAGPAAIVATADGGRTWRRQLTGRLGIRALDFVDARRGWAVGGRALLRTTDGGVRWTALATPPLAAVDFVDADRGWAVGRRRADGRAGTLLATADGGRTWVRRRPSADSVCSGGLRVTWVGDRDRVLRSSNGGVSWRVVLRAPGWWRAEASSALVGCAGPTVAYVLFVGGGAAGHVAQVVYRTLDAGRSWRPVLAEGMVRSRFAGVGAETEPSPGPFAVVDRRHAVFAGFCGPCLGGPRASAAIQATADGGRTWRRTGIPERCGPEAAAISFVDARRGWLAATRQRAPFAGCRAAAGGEVLATRDGGRSWRRVYP